MRNIPVQDIQFRTILLDQVKKSILSYSSTQRTEQGDRGEGKGKNILLILHMYIEVWHAPHTHRQQHHSVTDVKCLQALPQPQLVLHHVLLILLRIWWRKYNLGELYPGYTWHHFEDRALDLKYWSKWSTCPTLSSVIYLCVSNFK